MGCSTDVLSGRVLPSTCEGIPAPDHKMHSHLLLQPEELYYPYVIGIYKLKGSFFFSGMWDILVLLCLLLHRHAAKTIVICSLRHFSSDVMQGEWNAVHAANVQIDGLRPFPCKFLSVQL